MTLPTAAKQREISYDELRDTLNQKLTIILLGADCIGGATPLQHHWRTTIQRAAMEAGKFLREVVVK